MTNNQRKQNLERLQREQRDLVQPARIKPKQRVEQDLAKVRSGVSAVSLQSSGRGGMPVRESLSARIRRELQEQQRNLRKKNVLNKNIIF